MSISIHYVYAHIKNNEIVYIGKGKNERAWHTSRSSEDHREWIQESILNGTWGSAIKILKAGLNNKEAVKLEKQLIKEYNPKYNTQNIDVECPYCGLKSPSAGAIASHILYKHSGT